MRNVQTIEGASTADIADWMAARLSSSLECGENDVAISVPGGSTPFPIFEQLVGAGLDFGRLLVWPGDDRVVPEDHEASNTGKIRRIFEPAGARVISLEAAPELPHFAICWLGMGGDGHIASLFPNTDPQVDDDQALRRLTPDPLPPHAPFDRITMTIPALLNSDALVFTLGGSAEKLEVFNSAVAGEHDLPIARLLKAANERDVPVTCFT